MLDGGYASMAKAKAKTSLWVRGHVGVSLLGGLGHGACLAVTFLGGLKAYVQE